MSHVRVIIHAVWSTKWRDRILSPDLRAQLFNHIKSYCASQGIRVITISGDADHIHVLFTLKSKQCIAENIRFMKGESSYWINSNNLLKNNFEWACGYYAVSVSPENVHRTLQYINKHETKHRTISLDSELKKWFGDNELHYSP